MLTDASVTTVLPASDQDRAAAFYRDALGLEDLGNVPGGNRAVRTATGSVIEFLATDDHAASEHTVASFEVPDVAAEVADLESRGVSFLDVDTAEISTVDHIATVGSDRVAWFNDSEGNIVCVHQTAG